MFAGAAINEWNVEGSMQAGNPSCATSSKDYQNVPFQQTPQPQRVADNLMKPPKLQTSASTFIRYSFARFLVQGDF